MTVVDRSKARAVAAALLDAGSVTFTPEEPVTFKSGIRSPVYVDNRRLIFQPEPWHVVIDAFAQQAASVRADVVAGVESAGIPHSSALAFSASLPSVFVRKAAKGHGLGRRIEGGDVAGRRVALIEDMVTTGGSSLSAVEALREAGARVDACLAIITYGFQEAVDAFVEADVDLIVLTTFQTVLDVGIESGAIDARVARTVREWLADPHAWSRA
jgi:orotate phosphoribosyltransferase